MGAKGDFGELNDGLIERAKGIEREPEESPGERMALGDCTTQAPAVIARHKGLWGGFQRFFCNRQKPMYFT
jgi:hypothetical protein